MSPFTRVAAFYAAIFLLMGVFLPFWPIWLAAQGLSAAEIGSLMTAGILIRAIGGSAAPFLSDALGRPQAALIGLGALCAVGILVQSAGGTVWTGFLILSAAIAGLGPMAESLGYGVAQREGFSYALARSAGSASFILSGILCGALMESYGADAAWWWALGACAVIVAVGAFHPARPEACRPPRGEMLREAAGLILQRRFALFMIGGALIQASHAMYYAYGSLHWAAQGLSETTIAALWGVGVAAEIVLFVFADRALRRWSAPGLLMLGAGAGALRWGAMCFDPPLGLLFPLQATHALTFGAAHLGAMRMIGEAVPPRLSSTAQGLYASVAGGLTMAGANAIAATAYPAMGGMAYATAAGCALLGGAFILALRD